MPIRPAKRPNAWHLRCTVAMVFVYAAALPSAEPDAPPKPSAVAAVAPAFPADVRATLETLPKEIRPVELRTAHSGALYALLPNGAEIIVREKHNAPVISVQAWVRTGAIHEGEFLGAGLSHFCEHMLFKGTTKRPPGIVDQDIRGAGGDDNAYTTNEHTVYHVEGAADGFETSFETLADMLMDAAFPPEEARTEHSVVLKEIERSMDAPEDRMSDAWNRLLYRVHPYRVPVIGYPDQFRKVTRDEVYAYYKRRYVPQRTTFIAVGDIKAVDVMPLMVRVVAPWKRGNSDEPPVPAEPPQLAPREVTVTHPLCTVPKILIGFPSVSLTDPDLCALDVLASILGDGRSSRLYREVKDKLNLVVDIQAYSYTPRYPGEFTVSANTDAEKLAAARNAILNVLEAARKEPPAPEELARAKRKVHARKVFAEMTADGIADALGSNWLDAGDLDFSETYAAGIQKVTAEDVLRVARRYLDPQRLNIATLQPKAEPAEATAQVTPAAVQADRTWLDGVAGVELKSAGVYIDQPVWELTLANGVRVTLRRDTSLPAVHISFALLGGQRWEPAERAGASRLLSALLDRGTRSRNKQQLAAQVEDLGASLSTFSSRNSFGLQMRGLREDLPKLMELGTDVLLHPAFPKEELEIVREETLTAIEEQEEEILVLNSLLLRPLLFGAHPYSRELPGTEESVNRTTLEDLIRLHSAWVRPDNLSIGIVGDFNPREALQLVNEHFGKLKATTDWTPPVLRLEPLAGEQSKEATTPGLEGAVLTLAFRGVSLKDPDRDVLDVICGVLSGLGGRLYSAIREEKGMAYDVGVYSEELLDGGALVFYVQTDATKLQACREAMWHEIKRLCETTLAKEELDSVKRHVAGLEASAMQDQGDMAQRLALARLYGQDARETFGRRERVMAVTPEQVQAAAKKYFDPKRWVSAVVKPEEKEEKK